MLSPAEYYHQQKEHYSQLLAKVTKDINRIAMLRLGVAIGVIVIAIWALRSEAGWHWWLAGAGLALFLVLVRIYHRLADKRDVLQLHLSIIENELQALNGDCSPFADGTAYIDIAHPFSFDLDLFGKGSIYQLLCRTVTIGGGALLADKLSSLV